MYRGLSDFGLNVGSKLTGLPLGLASGAVNNAIDGAGVGKRRYRKKNLMVEGGTLVAGVPHVMRMGKGFTSSKGTHYGGSFLSPTSGGSFASA